jgi:septal ring factor EnvC (AmiA/AmiB activator)
VIGPSFLSTFSIAEAEEDAEAHESAAATAAEEEEEELEFTEEERPEEETTLEGETAASTEDEEELCADKKRIRSSQKKIHCLNCTKGKGSKQSNEATLVTCSN